MKISIYQLWISFREFPLKGNPYVGYKVDDDVAIANEDLECNCHLMNPRVENSVINDYEFNLPSHCLHS